MTQGPIEHALQGLPLHPMPAKPTPWRWAYAALGVLCFALGALGAVVPLLPTTGFLLAGSFLLTRSCPWLEEKLLSTRLLRPYAEFVRSREPMSMRMRIIAMSCMWCSIVVSLAGLAAAGKLVGTRGQVALWVVIAVGLVGTIVIARFRRAKGEAAE
jgi:uncharacterized protein